MRFWRQRVPGETAEETHEPASGAAEAIERPPEPPPTVEPVPEPTEVAEPPPEAAEPAAEAVLVPEPPARPGAGGVPGLMTLWRRRGQGKTAEEKAAEQTADAAAPPREPVDAVEPPPAAEAAALSPEPAPVDALEPPPAAERDSGLTRFWLWRPPGEAEEAEEAAGAAPETAEAAPEAAATVAPPPQPALAAAPPEAVEPPPAAAAVAEPFAPPAPEQRGGWFGRLRAGLQRSSARLNQGINTIFLRRRLDEAALAELEELLIASDMGVGIAEEVAESLRRTRFNQEVAPEEVKGALADQIVRLVEPVMKPLRLDPTKRPFVILVIGVNGSGKTTTIAKLAKQYRDDGLKVVLAAGDTFRAAAVEQLEVWGERVGARVISRPSGADAAGLAYDALVAARGEDADVLLIDTAGRLHNKTALMGELQKIVRVLKKVDPAAPHSVLLVLDATTGQNAHAQAEIFREMVGVTGIVMTKLDGTAKGGVLVSLAEKYGIPIHFLGVGETAEDLRPFEARAYARSLVGLDA